MESSALVGLIAAVIVERPTCLSCLADKAGTTDLEAVRTIERMRRVVRIEIQRGERCRACGSTLGPVYSMERDSGR